MNKPFEAGKEYVSGSLRMYIHWVGDQSYALAQYTNAPGPGDDKPFVTVNPPNSNWDEYKEPVIEIRYARAVLMDYDKFYCPENTTFWTRKKSPNSDNLKATWVAGILTSVEIIK